MRLFIAIEISNDMRGELAGILKTLKERSCGGRFVPVENFHITLHFIGESESPNEAMEAVRETCAEARPFTLSLGRYGFFDKIAGGRRTGVVEIEGELDALNELKDMLETALEAHGFQRDQKRFKPHITLGRNVEHDELVADELRSIPLGASVRVEGITLFESTRVKGRMVYTPLMKEKFAEIE